MSGDMMQDIRRLEREVAQLKTQIRRPDRAISAWSTAVSMALNCPGIVEFWQFGNYDKNSGEVYGLAQGRNLTRNNGVNFGWSGLVPFADFNGVDHYFSRTDEAQLDLTSATATQGVMAFGWFNIQRLGTAEMLLGKSSGASTNYNFYLYKTSTNYIQANVWDGTTQAVSTSALPVSTGWHYLGMIWNTSKISVFVNDIETSITASIPTTSNNSTAAFAIGARDGGTLPFDGLVSCAFLGQRTAQSFLTTFYEMTRGQYE